jgi:hypothetical protein
MVVRAVSMEVEALEVWERSCAMRGDAKDWDAPFIKHFWNQVGIVVLCNTFVTLTHLTCSIAQVNQLNHPSEF